MKKLLTVVLALMLMMTMTVPAFAAISPEAGVITTTTGGAGTGGDVNDSPQSPPTGNTNWFVLAGGVAVISAIFAAPDIRRAAALLKEKSEEAIL